MVCPNAEWYAQTLNDVPKCWMVCPNAEWCAQMPNGMPKCWMVCPNAEWCAPNAEWCAQMLNGMPKCWMACPNAEWCAQMLRKKIESCNQGALGVMHIRFFSQKGLVLDHPVPVATTVSGWYYCSLLQDKVRPDLRCKQLELLENGVISLQDNATSHHHRDVQNPVQCCGREVLAYPPYSPDLAPCDYCLFACVTELLQRKWFES